jgi:hypothetical protein
MKFSPLSSISMFGISIPASIVSLSSLAESKEYPGRPLGEDVLEACMYPSRQRYTDS